MIMPAMTNLNFAYRFSSGGESWFWGKYGGGRFSIVNTSDKQQVNSLEPANQFDLPLCCAII